MRYTVIQKLNHSGMESFNQFPMFCLSLRKSSLKLNLFADVLKVSFRKIKTHNKYYLNPHKSNSEGY